MQYGETGIDKIRQVNNEKIDEDVAKEDFHRYLSILCLVRELNSFGVVLCGRSWQNDGLRLEGFEINLRLDPRWVN